MLNCFLKRKLWWIQDTLNCFLPTWHMKKVHEKCKQTSSQDWQDIVIKQSPPKQNTSLHQLFDDLFGNIMYRGFSNELQLRWSLLLLNLIIFLYISWWNKCKSLCPFSSHIFHLVAELLTILNSMLFCTSNCKPKIHQEKQWSGLAWSFPFSMVTESQSDQQQLKFPYSLYCYYHPIKCVTDCLEYFQYCP